MSRVLQNEPCFSREKQESSVLGYYSHWVFDFCNRDYIFQTLALIFTMFRLKKNGSYDGVGFFLRCFSVWCTCPTLVYLPDRVSPASSLTVFPVLISAHNMSSKQSHLLQTKYTTLFLVSVIRVDSFPLFPLVIMNTLVCTSNLYPLVHIYPQMHRLSCPSVCL